METYSTDFLPFCHVREKRCLAVALFLRLFFGRTSTDACRAWSGISYLQVSCVDGSDGCSLVAGLNGPSAQAGMLYVDYPRLHASLARLQGAISVTEDFGHNAYQIPLTPDSDSVAPHKLINSLLLER